MREFLEPIARGLTQHMAEFRVLNRLSPSICVSTNPWYARIVDDDHLNELDLRRMLDALGGLRLMGGSMRGAVSLSLVQGSIEYSL
jgi:hypothetical protein